MTRYAAPTAFKKLEDCAGVAHVKGRGWYSLRRVATDLAEEMTTDDRVKDRLGGWRRSDTRKYIYQDRTADAIRAQAALVRRMRLGLTMAEALNAAVVENSLTTSEVGWTSSDLDAILARLSPSSAHCCRHVSQQRRHRRQL
jgi:hypothetical protein